MLLTLHKDLTTTTALLLESGHHLTACHLLQHDGRAHCKGRLFLKHRAVDSGVDLAAWVLQRRTLGGAQGECAIS